MLLGLDDTINSTIGYPDDRTPPELKNVKKNNAKIQENEDEDDIIETNQNTDITSTETTSSSNSVQATTEKSFFDVLREGLDMIDNHSERIGTIIDASTPNKTQMYTTSRPPTRPAVRPSPKPSASFLDLLLGPDDDDEDYEMWKRNQTIEKATVMPQYYPHNNVEIHNEHHRPGMPPMPVIIKPQSNNGQKEPQRNPQISPLRNTEVDSIQSFIPLRTNDNPNMLRISYETEIATTTPRLTTITTPLSSIQQSTTTLKPPSTKRTTIKPTTLSTTIAPKSTVTTVKIPSSTATTTTKINTTTTSTTTTTRSPSTTKKTTTTTKIPTTTKPSTTTTKVTTKTTTTTKPSSTTPSNTKTTIPSKSTTKLSKTVPTTRKPSSPITTPRSTTIRVTQSSSSSKSSVVNKNPTTTKMTPKTTINVLTPHPEANIPLPNIKPTVIYNTDDYLYDYNEPTLPSSLPNLKIIPFLPTDAVKKEPFKFDQLKTSSFTDKSPDIKLTATDFNINLNSRIQNEANTHVDFTDVRHSFVTENPTPDSHHLLIAEHKNIPNNFGGIVKYVNTKYTAVNDPKPVGYGYVENVDYAPGEYNSENPLLLYRFSPPSKTEGGFKPRDPASNSFYDNYSTTKTSKLGEFDLLMNNHTIDRFDNEDQKDSNIDFDNNNQYSMSNYPASFDDDADYNNDNLDLISITTDQPIDQTPTIEVYKPNSSGNGAFFGSVLSYLFNEGELPYLKPNQTINITSPLSSLTIPPFRTLPSLPKVPEMFDSDELIDSPSITSSIPITTPKEKVTSVSTISTTSTTTQPSSTEKLLPVYSSTSVKTKPASHKPTNPIRTSQEIENINLLFPHHITSSRLPPYKILQDDSTISNTESYVINPVDVDKLRKTQIKHHSAGAEIMTKPANSIPGLLKLAGCNIYGRMYRVGKIISELSGPCLECKCTEVGVNCTPLNC